MDINAERFEWRRYYPKWGGYNEAASENDRFWFRIRSTASRSETRRISSLVREAERSGEEIDAGVAGLMMFVRGPENLTVNGDPVRDLLHLMELTDAQDLVRELEAEVDRSLGLTEDEVGNSSALSGGGSDTPASAQEKSESGTPAEPASKTPGPEGAPVSSTPVPEMGETSETR